MKLVSVIRSYVGRELTYGDIMIRPWCFVEVPKETIDALEPEVKAQMVADRKVRTISIAMVADDKPVDEVHEPLVIQMAEEAKVKKTKVKTGE